MYLFYVLSLRQPRPPHQVILERTTPRIDWSIPEEFIYGHVFSTNKAPKSAEFWRCLPREYPISSIQFRHWRGATFVLFRPKTTQNQANQASGRIEPHKTNTPTKHDNTFVSDTVWSSDRARNTNLATACNCQHTTEKKEAHLDCMNLHTLCFPYNFRKANMSPQ